MTQPMPSDGELRAASASLQVARLMLIPSHALRVAVSEQTYLIEASVLGVGPLIAKQILQDVIAELSATGAAGDPFAIARNRIGEGLHGRPPEQLRQAARQILASGGYSLHPENVDGQARQLQRLTVAYAPPRVPWYRRVWRRLRRILRRSA